MPTYRICTIGSDGSLIAGEDIECADDQEAIEKASQAAKDSGVELWQRDHCVIQLLPALNFPSVRRLRRTVERLGGHTTSHRLLSPWREQQFREHALFQSAIYHSIGRSG
jgi:hypothetical protein